MNITLYRRDAGPVCYEAHIFQDEAILQRFPACALSSGLAWFWASSRWRDLAPGARFVSLPPKRILTQLKADNATSFVDDFRERNVDGYGRSVVVLGIDFDASECVRFPTGLQAALRAFVASEAEPLRLVMLQLGDSAEFVFVPRPPIEPVRSLLEFLGLNRSASIRISDYGKLGQLRLESSIDQYVALCFGPQSVAKPRSPE